MNKTKKVGMLLLAFLLCLPSIMMAQTNQGFSGSGSGTESDPYRVLDASDLDQMRNFLYQSGVYFKLMDDIDLTDWINDNNPSEGWQPIGVDSSPFKGVLDGNNKTISGLYINRPSTTGVGLFGSIDGATIKNLIIKGSSITGKGYVGSLSGVMNGCTISNITVELSSITGTSPSVGGLFGSSSTANSSITSASVKLSMCKGSSELGGIVGNNLGNLTLSDVTFSGDIEGTSNVGGVVGYSNKPIIMSNITITGNIDCTRNYVGGLVGCCSGLSAENCSYKGNINAQYKIGGLVGEVDDHCVMTNCSAEGNVTGTTIIGGSIGNSVNCELTNVTSTGNITGTGDDVGGILGVCSKATLTKCSSVGDVSGQNNIGGLVGYKRIIGNKLVIDNSFALGNITGGEEVGGLVGQLGRSDSSSSYQEDKAAATNISIRYSNSNYNLNNTSSFIDYTIVDNKYFVFHNSSNRYTSGGNYYYYRYEVVPTSTNVKVQLSNNNYSVDNRTAFSGEVIVAKYYYSTDYKGYYYDSNYGTTSSSSGYMYKYLTIPDIYGDGKNQITNSYFNGEITGTTDVGGIVGFAQTADIAKNYTSATVNGQTNVGGIVGKLDSGYYGNKNSTLTSNVAINSSVNASVSDAGRIYGVKSDNFWTIGTLGSATTNKALLSTQVSVNGVALNITEDLQNGNTIGAATLKKKASYQGIGWDMTSDWNIQETESYPYKSWQTAPPIISSGAVSGSTTIQGKCVDNGTVYIQIGNKMYTTSASGNAWTATVTALQAGTQIRVYAKSATKAKSYSATSYVAYPGSGTEADPYQIYSVADLVGINGNSHYLLMNDLDLTSWINTNSPTKGWVPVGRNSSVASHFDGGGHTISGLWIDASEDYTGLFGNASNATIKNLILKVATGKSVKGGNYTAALLGNANNTKISKCTVNGAVIGNDYSAILVGNINNGSIEECTVSGSVTGTNYIGGITGKNAATITQCVVNDANLTASATSAYIGGVTGYTSVAITKCIATSEVNATGNSAYAGGIAGYATAAITESKAAGSVLASGESTYAGGIVGLNEANANITNCYTTADVEGTGYVGGISAYSHAALTNCYASGNLKSAGWGAGIVGYLDGTSAMVKNCVALCPRIELTESTGTAKRVLGGYKNGAPDPTKTDNYALKEMVLSLNGSAQTVSDNILHGTAKEKSELQTYDFYNSIVGWNISTLPTAKDKIWYIENGSQYPVLFVTMAPAPVVISKPVTSITLSKSSLLLYIGGSESLVAIVLPDDATVKTLTWTSSDEEVATVNNSGVITAISAGEAVITAIAEDGSNVQAECAVTVVENTNIMYAGDVTASSNSTVVVPIYLENAIDVCAVQFDIHLPEGIDFDYTVNSRTGNKQWNISLGTERFEDLDHTTSIEQQPDGSLRVVIKSNTNTAIWDTDIDDVDIRKTAPLVNMTVKTAESLAEGVYIMSLSDVTLAHYDESITKYSANAISSTITVTNIYYAHVEVVSEDEAKGSVEITGSKYNASTGNTEMDTNVTIKATPSAGYVFINWTEDDTEFSRGEQVTLNINSDRTFVAHFALLGDTYEDDMIDVADISGEVSNILNRTVLNYREMKIADVYVDNVVDVADVASIVAIILSPQTVSMARVSMSDEQPSASLYVDDQVQADGKHKVGISLGEASIMITALQFDVVLPDGFNFAETRPIVKPSDLYHSVSYQVDEEGMMTVVIYSMNNDDLFTESGKVVSIILEHESDMPSAERNIEIKNIKGFTTSNVSITMEDVIQCLSADDETSIEALESAGKTTVYTLSGINVTEGTQEELPSGLYIVNGNKRMIK